MNLLDCIIFAGTPAQNEYAGILPRTTEEAATTLCEPIVIP
jgi:hypothetical protein